MPQTAATRPRARTVPKIAARTNEMTIRTVKRSPWAFTRAVVATSSARKMASTLPIPTSTTFRCRRRGIFIRRLLCGTSSASPSSASGTDECSAPIGPCSDNTAKLSLAGRAVSRDLNARCSACHRATLQAPGCSSLPPAPIATEPVELDEGSPNPRRLRARAARRRLEEPDQAYLSQARWQKIRKIVRALETATDVSAQTEHAPDLCRVHHVVPVNEGGDAFTLENLILLCGSHHHRLERERTHSQHQHE